MTSSIVAQELSALLEVLIAGIVLGAGLPALFALGVKSLNTGRVVVADGPDGEVSKPSTAGSVGAGICFAVCVLAVLFGIVVLIWGKQLFGA